MAASPTGILIIDMAVASFDVTFRIGSPMSKDGSLVVPIKMCSTPYSLLLEHARTAVKYLLVDQAASKRTIRIRTTKWYCIDFFNNRRIFLVEADILLLTSLIICEKSIVFFVTLLLND